MAEPILNAARVVARIRQRVAAGVPQHMTGKANPARLPMHLMSRVTPAGVVKLAKSSSRLLRRRRFSPLARLP